MVNSNILDMLPTFKVLVWQKDELELSSLSPIYLSSTQLTSHWSITPYYKYVFSIIKISKVNLHG